MGEREGGRDGREREKGERESQRTSGGSNSPVMGYLREDVNGNGERIEVRRQREVSAPYDDT